MVLKLCKLPALLAAVSITLLFVHVAADYLENPEETYWKLCNSIGEKNMPGVINDLVGILDGRRKILKALQEFDRIEPELCTHKRLEELAESAAIVDKDREECYDYMNGKREKLAKLCLDTELNRLEEQLNNQLDDQSSQLAKAKEMLDHNVVKQEIRFYLQPKEFSGFIIAKYREQFCEVLAKKKKLSSRRIKFIPIYERLIKEPCKVLIDQTELIETFAGTIRDRRDRPAGIVTWLEYRKKCKHIVDDDRQWHSVYDTLKEECSDQVKLK